MNKFKFTGKMLILLILASSIFNYVIEWDSNVGFFSLVISFFFIAVMINYVVFKLNSNKPDKLVKGALIIYFALCGASGALRMIISGFEINSPDIFNKALKLIVSPYEGLSFVLRFDNVGSIFAIIFAFVFILLIFNLTSEDDLYEFRKLQEAEEEEENKNKNKN